MNKETIIKEIDVLVNKLKEEWETAVRIEQRSQDSIVNMQKSVEQLNKLLAVLEFIETQKNEKPVQQAEINFTAVVEKPIEQSKEEVKTDLFGSVPLQEEKPKVVKTGKKQAAKETPKPSLQKPRIENLNQAIGLNDKFLFANTLFGDNMHEYTVAIHHLNSSDSLESAMDYALNLQQLYNWDMDNETVKQLFDLVDRRYTSP